MSKIAFLFVHFYPKYGFKETIGFLLISLFFYAIYWYSECKDKEILRYFPKPVFEFSIIIGFLSALTLTDVWFFYLLLLAAWLAMFYFIHDCSGKAFSNNPLGNIGFVFVAGIVDSIVSVIIYAVMSWLLGFEDENISACLIATVFWSNAIGTWCAGKLYHLQISNGRK